MTSDRLQTRRLTLRPLRPQDAPVIVAALNNIAISRWLAVVPFPYTLADAEWFINENLAGRLRARLIWQGDQFVGTIGLDGSLGYWIAQPAWGQGCATEAALAVVADHFATTDAQAIKSSHFVDNKASQKVLTKLGFVDVGGHMQHCKALGQDVPGRAMELTRARWMAMGHG